MFAIFVAMAAGFALLLPGFIKVVNLLGEHNRELYAGAAPACRKNATRRCVART